MHLHPAAEGISHNATREASAPNPPFITGCIKRPSHFPLPFPCVRKPISGDLTASNFYTPDNTYTAYIFNETGKKLVAFLSVIFAQTAHNKAWERHVWHGDALVRLHPGGTRLTGQVQVQPEMFRWQNARVSDIKRWTLLWAPGCSGGALWFHLKHSEKKPWWYRLPISQHSFSEAAECAGETDA